MSNIGSFLKNRLDRRSKQIVLQGHKSCIQPEWTAVGFLDAIECFAAGLTTLGIDKGVHVGLVADNHDLWLVSDLACLALGAVDVPRAGDSSVEEVLFVLEHSECQTVILEDGHQWDRLKDGLSRIPCITNVVVLKGESGEGFSTYGELSRKGRDLLAADPDHVEMRRNLVSEDDLATIVYTSGTTGNPKGVMLSHGNILHNLRLLPGLVEFQNSDVYYSFLPTWHTFERTVEYCLLSTNARIHYGNKLTLMKDLPKVKPTILAGVPRIWESIASGVNSKISRAKGAKKWLLKFMTNGSIRYMSHQRNINHGAFDNKFRVSSPALGGAWDRAAACLHWFQHRFCRRTIYTKVSQILGGRMRFVISGGGALPEYVDEFMGRAGITLLNGYGLTETAPVVSVRLPSSNVLATSGRPLPETTWRVMDEEGTKDLGLQAKGVLWIKGPQVMQGYYKNEDATGQVLRDGWFCSGDLAVLTDQNDVIICGRTKDTIVLRGGENVEPEAIEVRVTESPLVADCVLVGHTQKHLAALVVPDIEGLRDILPDLSPDDLHGASHDPRVGDTLHQEIARILDPENGFRDFERIPRIACLREPLSIESGTLTATLKKKRPVIEEMYSRTIEELFAEGAPPHAPA